MSIADAPTTTSFAGFYEYYKMNVNICEPYEVPCMYESQPVLKLGYLYQKNVRSSFVG